MIIKSMTRKTASYRQLIEYFLKEQKARASKDESIIIKNNIKGTTVSQYVKAFEDNETNRLIKRSNSVKIYHEVMSFSNSEQKISKDILEDLTRKFIELRNANSLCIAVGHYDKTHTHIHFCFSGTEMETGKSLRMSKADFALFKKELQEYQMERYPALSKSIVAHGKKERTQIKEREYQLTKRTSTPSEKERIKQAIEQSYSRSLSRADFMHRLREQGLQTYSRNNAEQGVVSGGRKLTFSHLGFDQKHLREIDLRDDAIRGIQVFRDAVDKKEKELENEREIEQDIEEPNDSDYTKGANNENDRDDEMDDNIEVEVDYDIDL